MDKPTAAALDLSTPRKTYTALIGERRLELQQRIFPILAPESTFVWEVGCGHGHFLTAYAGANPDQICIGVDIASDRIERAERKRDRAKLTNLHFIRAEAMLFLRSLPPSARLCRVFVLFPDPWPKSRHHKHRILRPDFLQSVAALATPPCQLHFRTDFKPYFTDASATIAESREWQIPSPEFEWPFEHATVFQNRAAAHHSFTATRRSK
ncbi:MAG: tRNA (guanosine(46)-N7)-methyltransferase TrmB [Verrucomicrobiota bacterium]|jgi:tRNA (guanine-N7-)-methyltransferase